MSQFKKIGGRYGMHSGSGHYKNLQVDEELFVAGKAISAANTPGKIYYVDRNHNGAGSSGDGSSWDEAFLTLAEAIAVVNADYTAAGNSDSRGRNRYIFIAEGWYAEVPVILTASDVHIIGVAPGSHDSTVIYGVPVAGTFSGTAGGPTLTLNCSNCTIANIGWYCSDPLYAAIRDGANRSDADLAVPGTALTAYNNKIINCSFVRDVADGELCGIDCVGAEGPIIDGCRFSTSCLESGVRIRSNGVINPVGVQILNSTFCGTPIGVDQQAGHNILVRGNYFYDDTTDRADTTDMGISGAGGRLFSAGNFFEGTIADYVQGTDTNVISVGDFCVDGISTAAGS